ncbi:MAG: two-component sensor histidine kinase [Rhodobacteraceae bacterium]|nr:two-component sensor histidine kinase [Paracoccaceae bacterium]
MRGLGQSRGKWRPSLGLILGLTLAAVLCLPLAGILAVRWLTPALQALGSATAYREAVMIVGVVVLLVTTGLGFVLWRILLSPIGALAKRAASVQAGDPAALEPMAHYGTQEMEMLGRAVLEMGRVLQGREAVLRSYADHATHELKSPLTVLRGAAELLDDNTLGPADRATLLTQINAAAARMTDLLDAQNRLAQAKEPLFAGTSPLSPLLAGLQAAQPNVTLELSDDDRLPMAGEGLELVLGHLIANAAAAGARKVSLSVQGQSLTLRDDGPGISSGNRSRIFDPFFTTKRETGGTGMGLPIVRRILAAHGARISLLDSEAGAGFKIQF